MALLGETTSTKHADLDKRADSNPQSAMRLRSRWLWLPFCVAALLALAYVNAFAVDVVWLDEWGFVPYLKLFNEGQLNYLQFLQWQHNEHKIFFPLILLFWLARLTHFDGKVVLYVGAAVMICTAALVLRLARPRLEAIPFGALIFGIIAFFMLDLQQWQNLIGGYSVCIVGASLLFVACISLLERVKKLDWRVLSASICAFVATYTYANGFLCWPIGAAMLFSYKKLEGDQERKNLLAPLLFWCVASVGALLFYFSGYHGLRKGFSGNLTLQFLKDRPWDAVQLALAALADPLAWEGPTAVATGSVLACLLIYLGTMMVRRKWQINRESIVPLAMMLFGFGSTAMIFIGRAADGFGALLTSRYASTTNLDIVGMCLLVATLRTVNLQQKTVILSCLAYAMVTVTISSGLQAITIGQALYAQRTTAATILKNYKTESDERLGVLCPYPIVIKMYAPYLEQEKYSVFRN